MVEKSQHSLPVTVAIGWQSFYGRQIVMGVMRYVTENAGRWSVDLLQGSQHLVQSARRHMSVGVIAHVADGRSLQRLARQGIQAVVAVLDAPNWTGVVANIDEAAVGRSAAEYLLNQGHRRFAVFEPDWPFAHQRTDAFRRRLAEAGLDSHDIIASASSTDRQRLDRVYTANADQLVRTLKRLPRPIAIFCPSDVFALGMAESCQEAGLRVPEDVAILGVDNDPMVCLMSRPRLSSIALPFEQLGYLAAQSLDQLLGGRKVDRLQTVQPTGVVVRQSTDLLAVEDPDVAAALRFVRERATAGITPDDVLSAVPVSRRSLERRFRAALGRTIMSEIHRIRIDRAKELLLAGDLRTSEIAERSGFLNASRLAIVFRRITGVTPSNYRKRVDRPSM